MNVQIVSGILIPFVGTTLGAGCVFFLKRNIGEKVHKILFGFAGGVMVAASFWSLLAPALEQTSEMGKLSFLPASFGFLAGMLFLLLLDKITPHIHLNDRPEGPVSPLKRTTKLILAVTIHNIPEGMAVGVVYAGMMSGDGVISATGALALSIGIAIQNFPEGAMVSMPLRAEGIKKGKTFVLGTLSGFVEPLAALLTIMAAGAIIPLLPYFLSFAAGAMIYVVVEELVPEMSEGHHSDVGTVSFSLGFVVMMILDVALG